MRNTLKFVPLALIVAGVAATPAAAAPAGALREFEGTVVSVNRDTRTFRLRDTERGTVRIKVNGRTRYERIAGFRGLEAGMTNIEAVVRRSGGRWVAREVERSGGGGEHGGGGDDDRGGDDDGGRGRGGDDDHGGDDHGGDDHGGDDHGGRGRG